MKSWKTTLFGALALVAQGAAVQWPKYAPLANQVSIGLLSMATFFAKDYNVSGSNTPKPANTNPTQPDAN
jgi:hypothetical protein